MIASANSSLHSLFWDCYRPRRLPTGSKATLKKYDISIRQYGRFLGRMPMVYDLDEDRIAEHLCDFAGGRSPATVEKQRQQLMALAVFAHKKGLIHEVPDLLRIRQPKRTPDSFDNKEMKRLVAAAWETRGEICGLPADRYAVAWILSQYNTGVRTSSVFGIELSDLRLSVPAIWFRWTESKTRVEQLLKIREETADAIRAILDPPDGCSFQNLGSQRQLATTGSQGFSSVPDSHAATAC